MQNKLTLGLAAVALGAAFLIAQPVNAQSGAPQQPGAAGGQQRHHGENWQKLAQELGLTDAQQTQIKTILQNAAAQRRAIMQNTSLTPDQKKEQLKQLRQNTRAQIEAVLTPDQLAKWKQIRQQERQNRGGGQGQNQGEQTGAARSPF